MVLYLRPFVSCHDQPLTISVYLRSMPPSIVASPKNKVRIADEILRLQPLASRPPIRDSVANTAGMFLNTPTILGYSKS